MTKVKKNSILFEPVEIEKIIRLSCYLKIYSIISNNIELKLGPSLHREIYNKIPTLLEKSMILSKPKHSDII